MKTLIALALVASAMGCSKQREERDPCERAAENVARLQAEDTEPARLEPFTAERCRTAKLSWDELTCLGYASSWTEARKCSAHAFMPAHDVSARN
jgi:hypothetical protein